MDNEGNGIARQGMEQAGADNGDWDAVGSLKRHAKRPDDEVTPLLAGGSGSSDDGATAPQEREWQGLADFEGLKWWHRPSVSWAQLVARFHPKYSYLADDIPQVVLVTPFLLPLRPRIRRHHRAETQPHPLPHLPRISD